MMRKGKGGMQAHFTKPVNAIARADQVTSLGSITPENLPDWEAAREVLHATVTNRKFRQFAHEGNTQEDAMLTYVDLCVKIGDLHCMRDGLFHYRTIAQNANAVSMEKVLTRLMDTAESRLVQSPEDPTLLKLVWESYKQVLELIKTTPKLDVCYHDAARRALGFCVQYNRTAEFKRLCDLLRWHYNNMGRVKNKADKTSLLKPELHIGTKVCQLEAACQLQMWRVAHESTDEMDNLHIHENAPRMKNGIEALTAYYSGCADVLWYSSGSEAEHAEALWKLYNHKKHRVPGFTGSADEQKLADNLVFATAASSNSELLELISRRGASEAASEPVSKLLDYLNNRDPHPSMCCDVGKLLRVIEEQAGPDCTVVRYFAKIKEIVLARLVTLLQSVYVTLSLDELRENLIPKDFMEWHEAEFVLMNLSRNVSVSVYIDRNNRSVTFAHSSRSNLKNSSAGSDQELLYNTVKALASVKTRHIQVNPFFSKERSNYISNFYQTIREQLTEECYSIGDRVKMAQDVLEKETEAAKREADHSRQADVRRREELQMLEEERQARAAKREEEQKKQRLLDNQRLVIAKKILALIQSELPKGVSSVKIHDVDLDKLDAADIASQKFTFEEIHAGIQKMKERERSAIKVVRDREEKRVDYTARAIREESIALWDQEEVKFHAALEEARIASVEIVAKRHSDGLALMQATTEAVQKTGDDNVEYVVDYISKHVENTFETAWPLFKQKVNRMIIKQAIQAIKKDVQTHV
eukprot:GHVH01000181.1.p1 GENE.GHVH01000181.1~~GHVH01000181.1.p1  ORF type:complete len:756 (+),score=117.83 GHVH01000181.1:67-2334(+)